MQSYNSQAGSVLCDTVNHLTVKKKKIICCSLSHYALINKTHVQKLTIHLPGQTWSSIILMGHTELNRTFYPVHCTVYTCTPGLKKGGVAAKESGTWLKGKADNSISAKWWGILDVIIWRQHSGSLVISLHIWHHHGQHRWVLHKQGHHHPHHPASNRHFPD